ncbi:MAG: radical SAM protein [Deltaproteobacteria bacterium]
MNETTSFTECFLILTEDCNLRCKYCYENTNRCSTNYMSFETGEKSIDFLINNALESDNKLLNITFFGGEPFLNLEVMIKIFHYAIEQAQKHNIGLFFSIVTNGTIYNKKIENFILECYKATKSIDIQISIDGIPEIQDKNRAFINNKPTSDIVFKNIMKLKKLFKDNSINTSFIYTHSVLTKDNMSSLFFSYKYLRQLEIGIPTFSLANEEEWDENDISTYNEQLSFIADYIYQECISLGSLKPYYDAGGTGIPGKIVINKYTCSAGKKFCAIVPNGDIYPCDKTYFYNFSFKLGNVSDCIIDKEIRKTFFDVCRKDMYAGEANCGECGNKECVCIAYNYQKYGDMLKCDPAVCLMYKARWNFITEAQKSFINLADKLNYNKCNEMKFFKNTN